MARQTSEEATQRRALFSAITGRSSAGTTGASNDVKGMLSNLYGAPRTVKDKNGSTRTISAVDTREAARRLGVTQRTVQRWLSGQNKPTSVHMKKIQTRSRQAATTKRGRERAVKRAIRNAPPTRAVKVTVTGFQGPHGAREPYGRNRNAVHNLSAEEYQQFLQAYTEGGDSAAAKYLELTFQDYAAEGWTFKTIDNVHIGAGGNAGREDPRAL